MTLSIRCTHRGSSLSRSEHERQTNSVSKSGPLTQPRDVTETLLNPQYSLNHYSTFLLITINLALSKTVRSFLYPSLLRSFGRRISYKHRIISFHSLLRTMYMQLYQLCTRVRTPCVPCLYPGYKCSIDAQYLMTNDNRLRILSVGCFYV